jgi:outer membrane protein assembly factor BamB
MTGLFLVNLFPFLADKVQAEDWPQWGRNAQRNMVAEERGLPARFEPGKRKRDRLGVDLNTAKNVKWVARLGSENYSSPIVADGRVYIGTNDETLDDERFEPTRGGVLLCLDEETGKELWKLVSPRLEIDRSKVSEDFDDMNLGICSSATVDENRVYIVSNRCEVLCLDAEGMANGNDGPFKDEAKFSVPLGAASVNLNSFDADILWRFDMLRDLPVFPHDAANCSVLIHDNLAYVVTANGVYDGKVVLPTAPSLIALNKFNGKLVARDDGHISAGVFHGQWTSPTLAIINNQPRIFFGAGDGVCYGYEPAKQDKEVTILKELWRFDANPAGYRTREGKPIDYWELVRHKDSLSDSRLIGPNEIIGTPVFHEGRLYLTIGQDPVHGPGRGALSCITPAGSGDITESNCLWQYTEIGRSLSTVSVADGLVYAAEYSGKVHCLDADDGAVQWVHDTGEEIWSSTLVADGKVYIGTRRGLVVLAAGREEQPLAKIPLGSAVWSAPTAANGTLFVASQRNLFAVQDQGE